MSEYLPAEDESFESASTVPSMPENAEAELTSELRGRLLSIHASKDLTGTDKAAALGNAVVEGLLSRGRFFHHAEFRDFKSAMFFDSFRKRLSRIQSDEFLAWVSNLVSLSRSDWRFTYIKTAMETAALVHLEARAILPAAFWATRTDRIYLSNGDGHAVRISPSGVELVDNGTDGILFAAGQTLRPWRLTDPGDPFGSCAVFQGMQTESPHGRDLFQLWAYSLPTVPASKPPIVLTGCVGSGKTRSLKGLSELLGVPWNALKVEEKTEADFWPAVNAGGLLVLDNADTRTRWLPDIIATAATDGCASRRRLYTDSDNVVLRANSWIGLTSANPTFGNDPGLADRVLLVRLLRRAGETADSELTEEVLRNRNAGLSHLAYTLSAALADTDPVPSGINSRHPDFARFAVRIGRALGREEEAIAAIRAAEADKAQFCLENDAVAAALLQLVERDGRVSGTAGEIGRRLLEVDPDIEHQATARRLSKRLSSLWPHLEKVVKATRHEDRNHVAHYTFKDPGAGFAGFQDLIS